MTLIETYGFIVAPVSVLLIILGVAWLADRLKPRR
jgi:hypothetical protein